MPYLVPVSTTELEPRPALKKICSSSQILIKLKIEILELSDFGHMTEFVMQFEPRDKILLTKS